MIASIIYALLLLFMAMLTYLPDFNKQATVEYPIFIAIINPLDASVLGSIENCSQSTCINAHVTPPGTPGLGA